MMIRLHNFIFDEKDIFIVLLGLFLVVAALMHIPLEPFRYSSLVVLVMFLAITRIIASQMSLWVYLALSLTGLLFSTILSPYGLSIYLAIVIILYARRSL